MSPSFVVSSVMMSAKALFVLFLSTVVEKIYSIICFSEQIYLAAWLTELTSTNYRLVNSIFETMGVDCYIYYQLSS